MRITGGEWRGRPLIAPAGTATRPTSDKVRQALFNLLGPQIAGAALLDLFAGTGAIGLEALSRGAARAVAVESSPPALAATRKNSDSLGATLEIISLPVERALQSFAAKNESFDIIFLDPPYRHDAGPLLPLLSPLLNPGATIILEDAVRDPVPDSPWGEPAERRYGDTRLLLWRGIGTSVP